jgi:hypothetical protein
MLYKITGSDAEGNLARRAGRAALPRTHGGGREEYRLLAATHSI